MTTEQRAEELESRVGSVQDMSLLLSAQAAAGGGGAGGNAPSSFGSQTSSHQGGAAGGGVPPQPPPRSMRPGPPPPVPPTSSSSVAAAAAAAASSSFETASPPLSGRSTPKVQSGMGAAGNHLRPQQQQDAFIHKYHTVSAKSLFSFPSAIVQRLVVG